MTRQVVLLRGVNVGGRHRLPMATLRDGLVAAGCTDVVTYIQSGNAVVDPPGSAAPDLRGWFAEVVAGIAGFPVPVVVRSADDLGRTVAANPYPGADPKQLHVMFFAGPPSSELDERLDGRDVGRDTYSLDGRDLYLFVPDGLGRSKLAVALDTAARATDPSNPPTTRNWNTVVQLRALAAGHDR